MATGSLNGSPSGVPLYSLPTAQATLIRIGTGRYRLIFAQAPNGTFRAWIEFATIGPRTFQVDKRDYGTGYVEFTAYTASGTAMDPANGEAIGLEYTAFAIGNPAGGIG